MQLEIALSRGKAMPENHTTPLVDSIQDEENGSPV